MSLRDLISKISKEDPCWTSKIQFSFGHNPVNKIFLNCHGKGKDKFIDLDDLEEMEDVKSFNLEMSREQILDGFDEEEECL